MTTKLKQRRTEVGITQKELAEKTELNLRTLQHYEQGSKDLSMAAAITVLRIAKVLGCSIEDLIESDN